MTRMILGAVAAMALSACQMTAPQTTSDFKTFTGKSMFGKSESVTVSRSHAQVRASLAAGAQKCLNRLNRTTAASPGPYGGTMHTYVTRYQTTVAPTAGGTEMQVRAEYVSGAIVLGPKGPQLYFIAEATPVAGGTKIDMSGARWGAKELYQAVELWARGGPIACPSLV